MKKLVYETLERPLVQASCHRPNITPKVLKNLGQGHCFSTLLHIVQQLTRAERDKIYSYRSSRKRIFQFSLVMQYNSACVCACVCSRLKLDLKVARAIKSN